MELPPTLIATGARFAIFPGVKLRVVEVNSRLTGTGGEPGDVAVGSARAAVGTAVIQEGSNKNRDARRATPEVLRSRNHLIDIFPTHRGTSRSREPPACASVHN